MLATLTHKHIYCMKITGVNWISTLLIKHQVIRKGDLYFYPSNKYNTRYLLVLKYDCQVLFWLYLLLTGWLVKKCHFIIAKVTPEFKPSWVQLKALSLLEMTQSELGLLGRLVAVTSWSSRSWPLDGRDRDGAGRGVCCLSCA